MPGGQAGAAAGSGGNLGSPGPSDAGGGVDSASAQLLPCEIRSILQKRCQFCHGQPERYGAPMPLAAWMDFQAAAKSNSQKSVREMTETVLAAGRMPPANAPGGSLTDAERATLATWLEAGAPASTKAACAPPEPPPPAAGELPCEPTHRFVAQGNDSLGYRIPLEDNHYACFVFPVPFAADEQAIAWGPTIDNEKVVHHYILYDAQTTTRPTGCGSNRTFLMGWAPGGSTWVMPEDVGLRLPDPGGWLVLEVHYNNVARLPNAKDRSGVSVCTSKVPRPKQAGVITFGQGRFAIPPDPDHDYEVRGECSAQATRTLTEPLRVLGAWPHMHQLGVKFRTDIIGSGGTRTLVDVPKWDFNFQTGYPRDPALWSIQPGDRVLTTCTYRNTSDRTVRFGERTEDEMCLNFTMVYPVEAIAALDRVPLRMCSF